MTDTYTREDAIRDLTQHATETGPQPEPVAETVTEPETVAEVEPDAEVVAPETEAVPDTEALDPDLAEIDPEPEPEPIAEVDAPQWWDKEAAEHFKTLPPEVQAIVKAQEDKREAVTQKEKAAAAEARKLAVAETERVKALSEKLDGILPDKIQAFQNKWNDVDWVEAARQYPNEYLVWQAEYTAEKSDLENALRTKAEADSAAQQAFANEQAERLRELAPDLASNHEALRGLVAYAGERGYRAEALQQATADDLVILNESRLYRELKAKAEAAQKAPPKPVAPPVKPVKATASPVAANPALREIQTLRNRFNQTKSREDALALMLAEDRIRK